MELETTDRHQTGFEPEMYCLRCEQMEWDEQKRCCSNFDTAACPLAIRSLLAGIEMDCLVI